MKREAIVSFVLVMLFLFSLFPMSTLSRAADSHDGSRVFGAQSTVDPVDWWPTFQHDLSRSGYSTSSAPNTAALIWRADYNEIRYGSLSGAITCNGVVFATDTNFVVALSETDGSLLWRHDMTGYGSIDSTPSTDGTLVYVVSAGNKGGSGSLHALSCSDGHEVWGQNIGGWNGYWYSPAISQSYSLVVVGSQCALDGPLVAGHVWAFNKNTGDLVWHYDVAYGDFSTSAAIDETSGKIFIVNENSNPMAALYSIDLASGNYLNAYYFTHTGGTGTPTVYNGKVYIESGSGAYYLYCFDENLGFQWNTRLYGGFASLGGLAAAYGRIFTGGDCVNAASGSVIWDHAGSVYTTTASPSVADGKMYWEDNNGFSCYNATTGALIWSYTAYSTTYGTPAISDGKVVFTSEYQAGLYVFGTYAVTIAAHCNAEGKDVSVTATMDGSSGQSTPCTFTGLTGTHTFTVPSTDANGDLFLQWSTGQTTTTITVSAPGTYTAYYAGYSVTINAHDDTEGVDVNVAIDEDHSPTGFTTPHTFSGLTGTHIFNVASTDPDNHSFKQWSNGVIENGISVSTPGGTYTAYYSAVPARIEYVQMDELNGFMMLTWSNPLLGSYPDTSVTSFKIYKGVNSNNPTYLTTVDLSQLYYNDYDVSGTINNFNTYYYWVTGVNSYGEGPMPVSGSRIYNGVSEGSFCPITVYSNPPQGGCLQWDIGRMFRSGQTVGAYNGGGTPMPFNMMFQTACPGYNFVPSSWQATGAISIDGTTTPNMCYITALTGSATLTGTFTLASPPPTYNVTIIAHCNAEGTDVSVPIKMDGASTGYNTPHLFVGLSGSHNFTVPTTDSSGHPFKEWNAGPGTTITVSTGGTYVAYYKAPPPYDVTINAHCYTESADVNVPITMDGSPSGHTAATFNGLTGTHTFAVPNTDANGHPFLQWSTGQTSTKITVSSAGTYTAYYQGSTYYVTISAQCNVEGTVGVAINEDGSASGYNTPWTFLGLSGSHTFTVPSADASGHPFSQWSTGETSATITVSSGGSHTAYYQAAPPATHSIFFDESGLANPAQVWSVTLSVYGTAYSNGPGNTIYTIIFTGVQNGGPYTFTVTPPSGFVAQPTSGTIMVNGGDVHQPITFTSAPVTYTFTLTAGSGGTVSYSFSLGSGTVLSGQSQQLTVPQSCQFTLTANPDSLHVFQTWSPTGPVSVSDPSSASTTATVNGNGGVTANFAYNLGVSISSTSKSIQVGESVTFTATASGGSGGYTYVWYWVEYGTANHDSYNSGSSSTYTFAPSEAGNYGIYVVVTDSSGNTGQSLSSSVTVTDFQLIVTPQSLTIPLTENAIFTVQEIPINGFINSVTLAYSNVPTGVFCDFAPSTIEPSQTSKASLTVTENAQVGSYSITITGTSGALTHQVTVKIDLTRTEGLLNILSFSHLNPESQLNHLGDFSIQQNFEVIVPSSSIPFVYWVQNVIIVTYIAGYRAAVATEVWNFTHTPPTEVPGTHRNSLPKYGISIPVTFNIASVISGNDLILSNDFESWTWSLPTAYGQQPAAAFIVNYDTTTRTINTQSPEFVVVGDMNAHQAKFLDQTDGSVTSMCLLMGQSWTKCLSQEIATPGNTATKETSLGLQWDKTGVYEVKFHAVPESKQEGIKFVPVESSTLHDGATMMDQTSLTGVSVSITGSSAPDGTSVAIATTALSGVPSGVVQVSTTPAAYYDVNVQGISDGTATVCITNSGVLGQTTMQYLNGAQWVKATDVVVSGNTICGNIPVSALTGTVIAIGPLAGPGPVSAPSVGGEWAPITMQGLSPMNTLQLLAPWISLALTMALAASFVGTRRKRKRQH